MKRFLALILLATMLLTSMNVSFAEQAYEEHIHYYGSGWMLNTNANYDDAYYAYFTKKFNMDFQPYYTDSSTNDSTVNLLVNTSSMPDGLVGKSFNYDTYLEWVDQGLIAPLPDGWETKYPNLYDMLVATGILDYITVDGQVFCIPHATWYNFVKMDTAVEHISLFYRKDWAAELGMTELFANDQVKVSDLLAFCKAAVDAGLGDNGKTVGLTTSSNEYIIDLVGNTLPYNFDSFNKTENGYAWGAAMEGTVEMVKTLREYYQSGSIDPDFYLGNGLDTFTSGAAAGIMYTGTANSTSSLINPFVEAHNELKAELETLRATDPAAYPYDTSVKDMIGFATVIGDDGVVYAIETSNYWSYNIFNPDIDPAVFDRILCLIDWLCTPEGEVVSKIGIPEVDWVWDVKNESIIQIPNADGAYNSYDAKNMLTQYGLCSDEMALVKKENAPYLINFIKQAYATKNEGVIRAYDFDYKFFTSQAKSEYSCDIKAEIVGLMVDGTLDIDTEWAAFIEENAGMVNPLIADLNAEFYPELGK